jgi:hypothetical protein
VHLTVPVRREEARLEWEPAGHAAADEPQILGPDADDDAADLPPCLDVAVRLDDLVQRAGRGHPGAQALQQVFGMRAEPAWT